MPPSLQNVMQRVTVTSEQPYDKSDLDIAGCSLIEDCILFMCYLADYDVDVFECIIAGDIELKLRKIPRVIQLKDE